MAEHRLVVTSTMGQAIDAVNISKLLKLAADEDVGSKTDAEVLTEAASELYGIFIRIGFDISDVKVRRRLLNRLVEDRSKYANLAKNILTFLPPDQDELVNPSGDRPPAKWYEGPQRTDDLDLFPPSVSVDMPEALQQKSVARDKAYNEIKKQIVRFVDSIFRDKSAERSALTKFKDKRVLEAAVKFVKDKFKEWVAGISPESLANDAHSFFSLYLAGTLEFVNNDLELSYGDGTGLSSGTPTSKRKRDREVSEPDFSGFVADEPSAEEVGDTLPAVQEKLEKKKLKTPAGITEARKNMYESWPYIVKYQVPSKATPLGIGESPSKDIYVWTYDGRGKVPVVGGTELYDTDTGEKGLVAGYKYENGKPILLVMPYKMKARPDVQGPVGGGVGVGTVIIEDWDPSDQSVRVSSSNKVPKD